MVVLEHRFNRYKHIMSDDVPLLTMLAVAANHGVGIGRLVAFTRNVVLRSTDEVNNMTSPFVQLRRVEILTRSSGRYEGLAQSGWGNPSQSGRLDTHQHIILRSPEVLEYVLLPSLQRRHSTSLADRGSVQSRASCSSDLGTVRIVGVEVRGEARLTHSCGIHSCSAASRCSLEHDDRRYRSCCT